MTANTELAGKILQSIADHPDEHAQAVWVGSVRDQEGEFEFSLNEFENGCGTQACIAGWTLLHEGYTFKIDSSWVEDFEDFDVVSCAVRGDEEITEFYYADVAARALVGDDAVGRREVQALFHDMSVESVIAKLTFFHVHGRFPTFDLTRDGDRLLEGEHAGEFIDKWYEQWMDLFPAKETV